MKPATILSIAGLGILSLVPLQAATIAWGTPKNTLAATDVVTTGTLRYARNFGSGTPPTVTVNTVTFTGGNPAGWSQGATSAALVLGTTTGDTAYDTFLNHNIGAGPTTAPTINPSDVAGLRIDNLTTFTAGKTYMIQVWLTDQRLGSAAQVIYDRQMYLNSTDQTVSFTSGLVNPTTGIPNITGGGTVAVGTASAFIEADPNNTTGASDTVFGQYITGTWVADGSPLYLLVEARNPSQTGGGLRPTLNGFQIREVPETSSSLLAALGTALVFLRRRR